MDGMRMRRGNCLLVLVCAALVGAGSMKPGQAIAAEQPLYPPPQMDLLNAANSIPTNPDVVTADTISQTQMTVPSLWWARDQYGGKLIENWAAYPSDQDARPRVDLVVNRQIWSLMSYMERYTFLNQFGTSARDFGYSTRLFNRQGEPLAAYFCTFPIAETHPATETAQTVDQPAATIPDSPRAPGTGSTGGGQETASLEAQETSTQGAQEQVAQSPVALMPTCRVELDSSGAGAFRSRTTQFGGS